MRSNQEVGNRLDSWKEIAAYLKRDVRTVRRWEANNRLPVHRIPGAQKVFAYAAELDHWLVGDSASAPLPAEINVRGRTRRAAWVKPTLVIAGLLVALTVSLLVGIPNWRRLTSPSPRFSFTRTDYPSPGSEWVVSAEFSGNGRPDLLFANGHSGTISLLLNQGDGHFGGRRDFVVGPDPEVLATGDFNNDGCLDVAVSRFGPAFTGIGLLLGDCKGNFREAGNFAIPNHTKGMAVGDFNRDGYMDLAVGMRDRIVIFNGKGDGTFSRGVEMPRTISAADIHAADLNHDGILDLVWADFGSGSGHTMSVALGNGDGTFKPPVSYPANQASLAVAVADLNHDGIPDIVTANFNGSVTVFLGHGDGTFRAGRSFPSSEGIGSIAVADLDGDGNPDLIVLNLHSAVVSVLPGRGDGTFDKQVDFPVGQYPTSVAVADLGGKGKPDLAVSASLGDSLSVMLNRSKP